MLVHDPIGSKGDGIAKPGSNETQRGEGQGRGSGDVKSTSVTATRHQRVVVEVRV